mmetsp:Transcript_94553/g.115814  ORF Transcript_94553/g.115814 Transcript_94553/m.115814 type:complete len:319 (-) Transcript_94553:159-1115(-)
MTFVALLFVCFVNSFMNLYDDCDSGDIDASRYSIVFCGEHCKSCNIVCDDPYECAGITLYSVAKTTTIECTGMNSCEYASFILGQQNIPTYVSKHRFNGDYEWANIICSGKDSCQHVNISGKGSFTDGIYINANGLSKKSTPFNKASLDCDLSNNQVCSLNCGNTLGNCLDSKFNCNEDTKCECISNEGCQGLINGITTYQTSQNQSIIESPTMEPTTSPTVDSDPQKWEEMPINNTPKTTDKTFEIVIAGMNATLIMIFCIALCCVFNCSIILMGCYYYQRFLEAKKLLPANSSSSECSDYKKSGNNSTNNGIRLIQ